MYAITLGGMSGGGARDIGPLVAQKLEADYVDRIFLSNIAKEVGATVEALHQREEKLPTREYLNFLLEGKQLLSPEYFDGLSQKTVFSEDLLKQKGPSGKG